MAGTAKRMVKVRLVAPEDEAQDLAATIAEALEKEGYEMIEWTTSYPCRPPDEDKSRVYLTALPKAMETREG